LELKNSHIIPITYTLQEVALDCAILHLDGCTTVEPSTGFSPFLPLDICNRGSTVSSTPVPP
jgi:hypothetical protein